MMCAHAIKQILLLIKINIDASWGLQAGTVGIESVVRDEADNFL